jgi:hypothetical protein
MRALLFALFAAWQLWPRSLRDGEAQPDAETAVADALGVERAVQELGSLAEPDQAMLRAR